MIKNIFKVSFRYLFKHKGYTFINIAGLAVSIAACILIMLFVRSEWSFNRMHDNVDRIHRAWLEEHYQGEIFNNTATPIPLGPLLVNNLPEVEAVTRIAEIGAPIIHDENTYNFAVTMADSTLFEVFDFPLLKGNPGAPFPDKRSILISEEIGKQFFGSKDPMGETLGLEIGEESQYSILTPQYHQKC